MIYPQQPRERNPIGVALLLAPVLIVLGASKGCAILESAAEDAALETAPATVREPPTYTIEQPKGWRI